MNYLRWAYLLITDIVCALLGSLFGQLCAKVASGAPPLVPFWSTTAFVFTILVLFDIYRENKH